MDGEQWEHPRAPWIRPVRPSCRALSTHNRSCFDQTRASRIFANDTAHVTVSTRLLFTELVAFKVYSRPFMPMVTDHPRCLCVYRTANYYDQGPLEPILNRSVKAVKRYLKYHRHFHISLSRSQIVYTRQHSYTCHDRKLKDL